MSYSESELRNQVETFCAEVGTDPLLVQGAGGNASWKDGDTLWVKASGTWLAKAGDEDIFVPVDLISLRASMSRGDFDAKPQVIGDSVLRPSIETMFHGLLPQRIVVHLHAVEVLARLVRHDCEAELAEALGSSINWALVGYHKPGAELARALKETLDRNPNVSVVFLKNHGVVIGGADTAEINRQLRKLTELLKSTVREDGPSAVGISRSSAYRPIDDAAIQRLALDDGTFKRLSSDWVLYPDHVVFLGPAAFAYDSWDDFARASRQAEQLPEVIFINGEGVYATPDFSASKREQLGCYADVVLRQSPDGQLDSLSDKQIAELLDWDAEKYRIQLARS